jgi:IS1 family transposase
MNVLPFDKQVAIISALTEGCSIRTTERLTGVHRDTTMRLAARVGFGAIKFHDRTVHSLQVPRLELDEAWSFVGKKQRRCTPADGIVKGDQYVFLGMSASSKAIVSFQVGKRNEENTKAFLWDLRERIVNAPEISTDAFPAYEGAIEEAFGAECRYGQIIKTYVGEPGIDAARRYSPGYVVAVDRRAVIGAPRHISTSLAERQNLSLRMASRRFTRLTNGFSKRADYHLAAVGLFVAHFNFCRVHEAHRVTPAMAQRITDHVWTIGELLTACLENAPTKPRKVHRRFTVIQGGKTD